MMDFNLDETQRVVAETAATALKSAEAESAAPAGGVAVSSAVAGGVAAGSVAASSAVAGGLAVAWQALAKAGLLALTLPSWLGGDDLGAAEAAVLLTEAGRQAATIPVLATIMLGALPVTRWGSRELQERLLAGVAEGVTILTAALREQSSGMPAQPATVADLDGPGSVSGVKVGVPYAEQARWILVSASLAGGGRAVVVVDPAAGGVSLTPTPASGVTPECTVRLDAAPVVGVLGQSQGGRQDRAVSGTAQADDPRGAAVDDLYRLALAGAAAMADGALAGALALTAEYIARREQFGRPLATFQAVAGQIADVYIASRTLHLAALSAAWRISAGLDATLDTDVAAYWLASEAPAALRTCHQLHGGIGVDMSYPLHRYSAMVTDLTRAVGGADYTLERLAHRSFAVDSPQLAPAGDREQRDDRDNGQAGLFVDLSGAQVALRDELRAYFAGLLSPEEREAMLSDRHGGIYQQLIQRMGADGWLGVGWPKEYGGRGFGQVEQQIFASEAARADIPLPAVTLQTVGPTLQEYGTAEQKAMFLPRILAGEVHFAIGYTEPGAGTDLASLTTRAVRDGDNYLVNGQKIFTTGAHDADYVWLACRTDPAAPKHKGLSILIVDTKDPGFSWTPIITCDGAHHVNATYYSDIRVPVSMRVGEENQGWRLITTQLNHERVMLGPAGRLGALHERVRAWAARTVSPGGRLVIDHQDVRRVLAAVGATLRVNELLNWQVAVAETVHVADASATKVFASERIQQFGQDLIDLVGRHGDPADPATAELMRWLDVQHKRNLVLTFGGGVNEVQRELIAMAGLGLPRVPR